MFFALLIMLLCVLSLFLLHGWLFSDKDCSQHITAFTTVFGKKVKEK